MGHSTFTNAVMAVHGGAGSISTEIVTPTREAESRATIERALRAGAARLAAGDSAVDAVCAAVLVLEDDPHFNAGRGASYARDGSHTLDSSLMDGATGAAGAVAGLRTVRNPVLLARAVMERSPYVFLAGEGADEFGRECGLEIVKNSYFDTPERWEQLQRLIHREEEAVPVAAPADKTDKPEKYGTVGAVARDTRGHIAAATSTGGMSGKRWGRVGDSPVIGAGTWATDATCAISGTGHGEYYLRLALAHDIAARMAYGDASLSDATRAVIHGTLLANGGEGGGVIALDAAGNGVVSFNTQGMYRGILHADGKVTIEIFED